MAELDDTPDLNKHATIFGILFSENGQENTEDTEKNFSDLSIIVAEEFIDSNGNLKRIPYEIIAKYVFNSIELYDEGNEFLYKNLEKMVEFSIPTSVTNITKFKDKVESHYKLSKEQKEYIQKNIITLNTEIESAKETIDKTVTETKIVNTDILNTKNKMYTEFVAILGIFSALMFGMISGFDLISDAIIMLAGEDISVGRIAIGSSALAISLIALMYTLVQWVGHLIKNPFRPENFSKDSPLNKGIIGFEYRHSLFLLAIYLLLNIMILGIILIVFSNAGFNDAIYNGTFSFNMIFKEKLSASVAIIINLVFILIINLYLIGYRLFTDHVKVKENREFKKENHKEKKKKQYQYIWNKAKEAVSIFFKEKQNKYIKPLEKVIKDDETLDQ